MEASTLRHASHSGLLARRSPLLRLQGDERLVALIRAGHDSAFEVLFDRYHARLLAFCRHMLRSSEDAEDVLQEVFTKAHAAILADDRHINVRPWLYRIARNRCLNHLRKPVPEGQDTMDIHPHEGGTTTAERVQRREDFRALVADVQGLPETQRTALLLREIDALAYEEIAESMDTTIPAVKSLLVRARMALAESTQSRLLTCGDVQLELAEAAEGLRKASGPVRQHVRRCEGCSDYRAKLRSNQRHLAVLAPAAILVWLHKLLGAKLFGLGSTSTSAGSAASAGAAAGTGAATACGGAATAGGGAATAAGGAALGGAAAASAAGGAAGGLGGVIGAKAVAGLATAALITAGAVEVRHLYRAGGSEQAPPAAKTASEPPRATAPTAPAPQRTSRPGRRADAPATAVAAKESQTDGSAATAGPESTEKDAGAATTSSSSSAEGSTTSSPRSSPERSEARDGALGSAKRGSGRRDYRTDGSGPTPVPVLPVAPSDPPADDQGEGDYAEVPPADDPGDDGDASASSTEPALDGVAG